MKIILSSFRWAHASIYGLADLSGASHGIRNRHVDSSQAAASQFQSAKITYLLIPSKHTPGDPITVGCCPQSRAQGHGKE